LTFKTIDEPDSSVGIATDYGLDGPGSKPGADGIFRPPTPALGPTQPPVQWVPGLSRGLRRPGRGADPHLVPKVLEKNRAILLLTLRACVAYKKVENLPTFKTIGDAWAQILAVTKYRQTIYRPAERKTSSQMGE